MSWRELGPIFSGGPSLLDYDLTHATSGLARYPAFDGGWTPGTAVIAPERVKVTRHSGGSYAGWSLYATGDSGLRYFITHIRAERAAVGSTIAKGGRLGTVGDFVGARVPHAHVGVNVELLLGAGAQLAHNTNYTNGKPTIGAQLDALRPEPTEEDDDLQAWIPDFVRWYLLDRRDATRPAAAPATIPDDVWALVATIADVHLRLGPPEAFTAWRDWRLLNVGDRPEAAPTTIPPNWWTAAEADQAFANRWAERSTLALRTQVADLTAQLNAVNTGDEERDARVRTLLQEALTALAP
jgi:hypothetical protein